MSHREVPDLIVVDVETTGLDSSCHVVLEVAAVNVRTGEVLHFVPWLHPTDLGNASPQAMQVNRYFERGTFKDQLSDGETRNKYQQLWDMLQGNTFGGANARFDAEMLCHGYGRLSGARANHGDRGLSYTAAAEVWRYRLADLGSYAAGPLGLDPSQIPSLTTVCKALGVKNADGHTALGDARAAAECFRILAAKARERTASAVEVANPDS